MKEFCEEGNKDSKFIRLNEPIEKASTAIRWDNAELAMKDMMCADDLKAKIIKHRDCSYSVVVTSSLKKLDNPVYLAPLQKRDMQREWKGRAVFDGMLAEDLSEFYIVSSQSDEGKHHESVIRIASEGMPNDRDTAIYKSIIKNKRDFIKFLELMLSDQPVQYLSNEIALKDGGAGESAEGHEFAQIYEKMLRVAATNPNQLFQIGKILNKLDDETIPEEFDRIYKQFSTAIK